MPATCMSRLSSGDFPHASGKTFWTAVQYATSTAQIPSISVSPLAMFRNVKRQPYGDDRLSSIILAIVVSATTPVPLAFELVEGPRIKPKNGEAGFRLSQSEIAAGTLRAVSRGDRLI